jgi:hypothetical protein
MEDYLMRRIQHEKEIKEWEDDNIKRARKKKMVKKIVPKQKRKIRKRKENKKPTALETEKNFITLEDLVTMDSFKY